MSLLQLKDYDLAIQLSEEYNAETYNRYDKDGIVELLLNYFLIETRDWKDAVIPDEYSEKRSMLKGILNMREPQPLDPQIIRLLNTLLKAELDERGIVDSDELSPIDVINNSVNGYSSEIILWKGDITLLNADAIVNASNKYLLGCFQPLHACIDNTIHSAAGPQLRADCNTIMSLQKESEKTGKAKITRAYNLPSKFVLHTVGPIISRGSILTEMDKNELASCYISCLELANEKQDNIKSIAFCAISTGVFGFPKHEAAEVAIQTVKSWIRSHPNKLEKIIFNVFSDEDYEIYSNILKV